MTSPDQAQGGAHGGGPPHFFFVDGKKYDWPSTSITGAQIKASIPGFNPTFMIVLEGHGTEPDRPIVDTDTFSLELPGRGPLHFYTAPPATFGDEGKTLKKS